MGQVHWLLQRFADFGHQEAIIWRDESISYRALLSRIEAWRDVLQARRIHSGACVEIYGDYSPDVCALLFALFLTAILSSL